MATQRRWLKWVRYGLSAAVLVLAIVFALRQDWGQILQVARRAQLGLLALMMLLNVPLVWCKARRLHLFLRPTLNVPSGRLMRFFFTSYAADNLLMSHAGIGVRVALLRGQGAPWSTAVAVQGVEKVFEALGIALVAMVVQLSPSLSLLPAWIAQPIRWSFGVAAAAALAAVALLFAGGARAGLLRRLGDAATALKHPWMALEVTLWTVMTKVIEVLMVILALRALDLPAGVVVSSLVLLAITLGSLLPGLPGNFGTFEASAVVALRVVGVDQAAALGWALIYHFLQTMPVTLVGLPGLRATGRATERTESA